LFDMAQKFKDLNPVVKALIIVGSLAAVGGLGVLGARIYTRQKDKQQKIKDCESGGGKYDTKTNKCVGGSAASTTPDPTLTLGEILFGNTPSTCKHCVKNAAFPLKKGARGKQVAAIQYAFNQKKKPGKKALIVDGDWGKKTTDAIEIMDAHYPGQFLITNKYIPDFEPFLQIGSVDYQQHFKQYENI